MASFMKIAFSLPNEHVGDLLSFLADKGASGLEYHSLEWRSAPRTRGIGKVREENILALLKTKPLHSREINAAMPELQKKQIWAICNVLKNKKMIKRVGNKWSIVK